MAESSRRRSCPGKTRRPGSSEKDRKSTRLNSSHLVISYAVFCLKKTRNPRKSATPAYNTPVPPPPPPFHPVHTLMHPRPACEVTRPHSHPARRRPRQNHIIHQCL